MKTCIIVAVLLIGWWLFDEYGKGNDRGDGV